MRKAILTALLLASAASAETTWWWQRPLCYDGAKMTPGFPCPPDLGYRVYWLWLHEADASITAWDVVVTTSKGTYTRHITRNPKLDTGEIYWLSVGEAIMRLQVTALKPIQVSEESYRQEPE